MCAALTRCLPITAALSLLAASAPAQNAEPESVKVRVSKKDCDRLVRHVARADVAYKPGVDVRGNPVAPADLAGGVTLALPEIYEFNVGVDLAAKLGGGVGPADDMDLTVGTVRYDINSGAMTFNGQPLNDAAMSDLAERCRAAKNLK